MAHVLFLWIERANAQSFRGHQGGVGGGDRNKTRGGGSQKKGGRPNCFSRRRRRGERAEVCEAKEEEEEERRLTTLTVLLPRIYAGAATPRPHLARELRRRRPCPVIHTHTLHCCPIWKYARKCGGDSAYSKYRFSSPYAGHPIWESRRGDILSSPSFFWREDAAVIKRGDPT